VYRERRVLDQGAATGSAVVEGRGEAGVDADRLREGQMIAATGRSRMRQNAVDLALLESCVVEGVPEGGDPQGERR
jgi:hypothetical protein